MANMYIVCWGSASCDDHGNAHANAGIYDIYSTLNGAKYGLTACKDEMIADTKKDLDPDGEFPELLDELDIQVYGSEAEEYYEIDYTIGTDPCEVHIKIVER